jgi:hypothetical protein
MTFKTLIKLIFMITFFQNCDYSSSTEKPELSGIRFDEEFTIAFSDVIEEELLIKPAMVKTGMDGKIFIADERMKRIQVFDHSGEYLQTIGNQGKGPGEFEGTPNFAIDGTGNLTVIDGRNRRISLFSYSGEKKITFQPSHDNMIWAHNFQVFEDGQYLLLRKLLEFPLDEETHRKKILHVFNSSFDEREVSFANYDELIENKSDFVKLYTTNINPGNMWIQNDEKVWYVPGIYEGSIYKYERVKNQWVLGQELEGVVLNDEAVKTLNENDQDNQTTTFHVFSGGGPYHGKILSESLGIFSMTDETIVHLSNQIYGDERVFLVECFDKKGKLLKTGQIEGFNIAANTRRTIFGDIWKDESDRFYIIDKSNDLVKIGKIKCQVYE